MFPTYIFLDVTIFSFFPFLSFVSSFSPLRRPPLTRCFYHSISHYFPLLSLLLLRKNPYFISFHLIFYLSTSFYYHFYFLSGACSAYPFSSTLLAPSRRLVVSSSGPRGRAFFCAFLAILTPLPFPSLLFFISVFSRVSFKLHCPKRSEQHRNKSQNPIHTYISFCGT